MEAHLLVRRVRSAPRARRAALLKCRSIQLASLSAIDAAARAPVVAVFELAAAPTAALLRTNDPLSPLSLAMHRPIALLSLVPRAAVLFMAGALSGAVAKTITAPLDRVKILLQVKGGLEHGAVGAAAASGNLVKAFLAIGKAEGLLGYWKGNLPQVCSSSSSRILCSWGCSQRYFALSLLNTTADPPDRCLEWCPTALRSCIRMRYSSTCSRMRMASSAFSGACWRVHARA